MYHWIVWAEKKEGEHCCGLVQAGTEEQARVAAHRKFHEQEKFRVVKGPVVGTGGDSKFTVTLKPGTYTFFCSVPGHEAGGMKGTLVVK